MSDLIYRFKHNMLADKPTNIVTKCNEHNLDMPHAHYIHRKHLEWIDALHWRWQEKRLKKLTNKAKKEGATKGIK